MCLVGVSSNQWRLTQISILHNSALVSSFSRTGVYKYNYTDRDVVSIANPDAYGEQNIVLKLTRSTKPRIFNQASGTYEALDIQRPVGTIRFKLEPAGGVIFLFD